MNDRCFITGLDRFEFHAYPGEWEMRSGDKYAWRYLLFLRHLTQRSRCVHAVFYSRLLSVLATLSVQCRPYASVLDVILLVVRKYECGCMCPDAQSLI